MIIATTGHRPGQLSWKYNEKNKDCVDIKSKLDIWLSTRHNNIEYCISGCAIGWDMIFAETCLKLNIPLHCYIPFYTQADKWSDFYKKRYADILKAAAHKHYTSKYYYSDVYLKRNREMIDKAQTLIAMWNPDITSGGTYYTVQYAQDKNVPVINLWPPRKSEDENFGAFIKREKEYFSMFNYISS